jgi:U32 family peptidase
MNIELLAPSGDEESFYTAVDNGANAIYLGIGTFNARVKAKNFDYDSLSKAVRYAHLFGVKVYCTINILMFNGEEEKVLDTVGIALKSNIDAFIIQDIGLSRLLIEHFKGIRLFASTQMAIHNLSGAKVLEELGFERVILSRETTLNDIREIHKNTNLQIEFFIQGALCVAFSGNCYMSNEIASMSGNRGKCLQFCRLPYDSYCDGKENKSGYLLSTKDLCLIDRIKDLVDAGITSFKIEGRLKRPGYVAEVVSTYRKVLDNNFNSCEEDKDNLKVAFNRGDFLKNAYLDRNNLEQIIYSPIQNHKGLLIGKVKKVENFKYFYKITIYSNRKIHQNDGLKFIYDDKENGSLGVGNVNELGNNLYEIFSKVKPNVNDDVCLINDSDREKELLGIKRKLKIDIEMELLENKYPKIVAIYKGKSATIIGKDKLLKAKTLPITYEEAKENISKMNDTNFCLNDFKLITDNVFVPKSILNSLRRNVLSLLENNIVDINKNNVAFDNKKIEKIEIKKQDKKDFYVSNNEDCLNYDFIIYKPNIYSIEKFKLFVSNNKLSNKFIYLPIILCYEDIIDLKDILDYAKINNVGIVVNNYGHLGLAKEYNLNFIVGPYANVVNNYSAKFYQDMGAKYFCNQMEIKNKEEENFVNVNLHNMNYAVMFFAHCPFKNNVGGNCNDCKYSSNLVYKNQNNNFKVIRNRIHFCSFELVKCE